MSWGQSSQETSWDYTKIADYSRWNSDNTYAVETGRYILPVAEAAPTSQSELADWSPVDVIQVHAPYSIRKMDFATKKKGTPPVVPSPADSGSFLLLEAGLGFTGPSLSSNGLNYDWEVEGTYLYIQNTRFSTTDGFVLTGFPMPTDVQLLNRQQYSTQDPQVGPVSDSGLDVQTGYAQGLQVNFADPYYRYNTPTYFPAKFLNGDLTIGGLPPLQPALTVSQSAVNLGRDIVEGALSGQ